MYHTELKYKMTGSTPDVYTTISAIDADYHRWDIKAFLWFKSSFILQNTTTLKISNMGCGPAFWGITGLAGAIIAATMAIGLPFLVNYLVDEVS